MQTTKTQKVDTNLGQVPVHDLRKGIYMLSVETGKEVYWRKVVRME